MKINNKITGLLVLLMATATMLIPSCAQQPEKPQANRPPVIDQIVGQTSWLPSTEGSLTSIVSDPDGDNLTYTWTADNGTITGQGPTITWTSPATMGKYNITLTVTDGKGGEAKTVAEEKVIINSDGTISQDAPIIVKMKLPAEDVVTAAKRVRIWTASKIQVVVEDKDDNSFRYKWSASNGKLQAKGIDDGIASSVTWIAPGAAGDYTVDVNIIDHTGNKGKGTVNFKVFCCGN
jgi:hypothetical protein